MSLTLHHHLPLRKTTEADYQEAMTEWQTNYVEKLDDLAPQDCPHSDYTAEFVALGLDPARVRNTGIATLSRGPELCIAVFEHREPGKPVRWFVREHCSDVMIEIPAAFGPPMQRCLFQEDVSEADAEIGHRVFEHISRQAVAALYEFDAAAEELPADSFETEMQHWATAAASEFIVHRKIRLTAAERDWQLSELRGYFSSETLKSTPVIRLPWRGEQAALISKGPCFMAYVVHANDAGADRWFCGCPEFDRIDEIPAEMGKLLSVGLSYEHGRDRLTDADAARMDDFLDGLFRRWYMESPR